MREFAEIEGRVRRPEVARPGTGVGGGRRRASGPRPVRPVASAVAVRPVQPARPPCRTAPVRVVVPLRPAEGERLLERAAPPARPAAAERLRRMLAGLAVLAVTAAVVVGLGLLADGAGAARAGASGAVAGSAVAGPGVSGPAVSGPAVSIPAVVTVERAGTVWDVARQLEPAAGGPALAALVQRIVTANGLASVSVVPGQVLRVPAG